MVAIYRAWFCFCYAGTLMGCLQWVGNALMDFYSDNFQFPITNNLHKLHCVNSESGQYLKYPFLVHLLILQGKQKLLKIEWCNWCNSVSRVVPFLAVVHSVLIVFLGQTMTREWIQSYWGLCCNERHPYPSLNPQGTKHSALVWNITSHYLEQFMMWKATGE